MTTTLICAGWAVASILAAAAWHYTATAVKRAARTTCPCGCGR